VSKQDEGTPAKRLSNKSGARVLTICDTGKQKEQLLEVFADSDILNLPANRKTLHQS
jgi:hypothetical protein